MQNDHNEKRRQSPEDSLNTFLAFLDEDPTQMTEGELNAYLGEAGLDFEKFNARLANDIELAMKKARLALAKSERLTFLGAAKQVIDLAAMSLEQKRAEIRERLGLLSGNAAAVYNRNYENAEDEEDLDDLLTGLRSLDERADGNADGA